MHSNRVALLNFVLVASAYFGLMNSEIAPWVSLRTSWNSGTENTIKNKNSAFLLIFFFCLQIIIIILWNFTKKISKHSEKTKTLLKNNCIRIFVFPGKMEFPLASTSSFPIVAFIKGSSWLYSTLMVKDRPSLCLRLQIAPTASPGFLGIAKEFTSKFFVLLTLKWYNKLITPKRDGRALKHKALVSWKKTTHFLPY